MNTLADLHFLRPAWLLLLAALPVLLWVIARPGRATSRWRDLCDPELLAYLGYEPDRRRGRGWLVAIALAWIIASLAAAGPAFRKQPEALFKRLTAQVILFDLSRSMLADDLKPSRLDQARFKLIDILERVDEGQIALVAFAGEPFIVSPLTDDANTVRNMVNALHPSIMPAAGSEADEALELAADLLARVGDGIGDILVLTDDANDAAVEQARLLAGRGIRVSVLGVGTPEGAPIALPNGGVLTTSDGRIVLPQLNEARLADLARAGGGRYVRMQSGPADLDYLFGAASDGTGDLAESERESARWRDDGPWLVLLLLPLAALAFRRGVVLAAFLAVGLGTTRPATAASWAGLWKTPEQRAAEAMVAEEFKEAARLAEDPLRRGNALYRVGEYEAAAAAYAQAGGVDGPYNLGNALARQERYEEAIAAYDRALTQDPEHEDARHNKELLEQLLQQQQQEQQDQQSDDSENQEQQQDSEGEGEEQEGEQQPQEQQEEGAEQQEESETRPEPVEEELSEEEQQALEQWLRRIPDDPGGLLRRKFLLEYQRRGSPPPREQEDW